MRRFFARFRNLFRTRAEREMIREIESHLALIQEDFEGQGMPPEEARLAARRAYGSVEQAKELHRETRSFAWIEQFFRDVHYTIRNLRRSPGFTLTAVAALALGIGATTAIFSIVNAALLKPIPVEDPDRLMIVLTTHQGEGGESGFSASTSATRFVHYRRQTSVLQDVSAYVDGVANYMGGDVPEMWESAQVSATSFKAWGVRLLHGRPFTEDEERPGGANVAILGEGLWKQSFAGDPKVLGRTIHLNGEPHTVIGVVADNSGLLALSTPPIAVFLPYRVDPNTKDVGSFDNFWTVARLKPGVTREQAHERLQASAAEYRAEFPKDLDPNESFTARPIREVFFTELKAMVLVLAGAVGLVLLIACANVANLLLARAAGRKREMGIRVAVGAGRARVIRQLLTESVILALAGGAIGLLAGSAGIETLVSVMGGEEFPSLTAISFDWRVAAFGLGVALVTGMAFGLFPALHASRVDLNSALKDTGHRWATGFRQSKARATLVMSEVSLAVILLVGSALLIRTFVELYRVDRGFETKNVAVLQSLVTDQRLSKTASTAAVVREGLRAARAVPGVQFAAATCCAPLQSNLGFPFEIAGRESVDGQNAGWNPISGDYFEVLGIPLKRGRVFHSRDTAGSTPVVIISERMAKEYWKDRDPLGDRIVIGKGMGADYEETVAREIVGVVGDVRHETLSTVPAHRMYLPFAQLPDATNSRILQLTGVSWLVRTQNQQPKLLSEIREQIRKAGGVYVAEADTMDKLMSVATNGERFSMMLMTIFGVSALLLATVGIYGLMAYTVHQRTHEIGVRLALGADGARVRNMVVRQGMVLAGAGALIGLAGAWALSRVMEGFLFGVQPQDPVVFVSVPVVLCAAALAAVWIPARRALKVDPVEALRCE